MDSTHSSQKHSFSGVTISRHTVSVPIKKHSTLPEVSQNSVCEVVGKEEGESVGDPVVETVGLAVGLAVGEDVGF